MKKSVDQKLHVYFEKMSVIGRSGKCQRWRISQQLAELRMQGWMSEENERAFGDWEVVWLTERTTMIEVKWKGWNGRNIRQEELHVQQNQTSETSTLSRSRKERIVQTGKKMLQKKLEQ